MTSGRVGSQTSAESPGSSSTAQTGMSASQHNKFKLVASSTDVNLSQHLNHKIEVKGTLDSSSSMSSSTGHTSSTGSTSIVRTLPAR